ncbi:hypothetical protein [Aequorivita sinensis]|uniref:hypothetical protein n=1 Tax=Aequorivita sinensis TaxID=1382458 RepID=UPI00230068C7|nr:hypothetical protein [Aequorivita sinensis]
MVDILIIRKILNLIFLFSTVLVFSQEFSKSDFVKTDWFVDNENGAFMKSDTLKFIKYSNKALDEEYIKYKEYELKYFGHGYFVELDFKRGRKMNYRFRVDNSATGFDFKKYRWRYDKKTSIISVYQDGKLMMKIKPIERKKIKIESRLAKDNGLLETTEITFVRIK